MRDGVLARNLYLVGQGDPALHLRDLEAAADQLQARGLKAVAGDIVYDVSLLDEEKPSAVPYSGTWTNPLVTAMVEALGPFARAR